MNKTRVCLYGNSVILGGFAANLRCCPQFELVQLTRPSSQASELEAVKPDIVAFDLGASHNVAVFTLLEKRPNLTLIGISPDTNVVKIWSGRQLRELSTMDLIGVINKVVENSPAI